MCTVNKLGLSERHWSFRLQPPHAHRIGSQNTSIYYREPLADFNKKSFDLLYQRMILLYS